MKTLISFLIIAFVVAFSEANPTFTQHQALESFKLNETHQHQNQVSCSYRVTIKTSCSSPRYTRDQISLAFGDAYGNQVYAPRVDDPSSRAFERCSTDTYEVYGPCAYQVCYLYLYRNGYDGWKPEKVTVYGYYIKAVTFYYTTFIPNGIWYGFNLCHGSSAVSKGLFGSRVLKGRGGVRKMCLVGKNRGKEIGDVLYPSPPNLIMSIR